jgi:HSP20 family protein
MTDKPTTAAPSNLPEARGQATAVAPRQHRGLDPFLGLRHQIDRLFDDFGFSWPHRGFLEQAFDRPTHEWVGDSWGASDVSETDGAYRISIELPGCEDKDLDVSIANGSVNIRGEKKQESKEAKEQYHAVGRRYGSFQQSFRLPGGVDAEKINATFKNGVLELTLPKTEAAKKSVRKIAVSKG